MISSYLKLLGLVYGIPIKTDWTDKLDVVLKAVLTSKKASKVKNKAELDEAIEFTGYAYDPQQDIFYSVIDPWQRKHGYCHLYDELSAPWGMIMDCEPVYFDYDNRRWMISFWKGQYDLTSGCEMGIYTKEEPNFKLTELLTGTFYNCAKDEDMMEMAYTLYKNGEPYFKREGTHWWLTGFKLGDYTEPHELTMDVRITLKNQEMAKAFVAALKKAGYLDKDINIADNTVSFYFDKPHTPQPLTREKNFEGIIQWKNKLMCDTYQEITKGYDDINDKLNALKEQAPWIYNILMHHRKMNKFFNIEQVIEGFLL